MSTSKANEGRDGSAQEDNAEVSSCLDEDGADTRRRAGDIAVVAWMESINFDSTNPLGQAFVKHVRQQGSGTLLTLNRKKVLFARALRLGIPLPPPPQTWNDEAYSLINEAALAAAPRFLDKGLPSWRSDGGTSIATYFVNYIIMNDFKILYTRFCRLEQAVSRHEVSCDVSVILENFCSHNDLEKEVTDQVLIDQAKQEMTPRTRQVAELIAVGMRTTEIAKTIGVTPKTIRRDVRHIADLLRDRHGWTAEDGP